MVQLQAESPKAAAAHGVVPPGSDSGVAFEGVSQYFLGGDGEASKAVDSVTFHIPQGQFLAIVGPSGCGKTTLLNMVAGMVGPTEGTVRLDGKVVDGPSRKLGFMTARDGLLPWRTARDNVAYGLEVRGVGRHERHERAQELLERVGLGHVGEMRPGQLSQGMRQRVAIARTLAVDPGVFLLDEPFAALDAQTKIILQEAFIEVWERDRKTVLLVTHDIGEAVSMADRVIVMSGRPGRIRLDLPVDLPRPRHADEIRFDDRFVELTHRIWNELRNDVHGIVDEGEATS